MNPVDGVFRMMPVDERVVKPDFQTFGPEGINPLCKCIFSAGGIGGFIISEF